MLLVGRHCVRADLLQMLFDRFRSELLHGERDESLDPGLEYAQRCADGLPLLCVAAYDRSRIRHAPMGRDRITRPDRTDFASRLVAYGDDEIHHRRAGAGKFLPALRAQPLRRKAQLFQKLDRERVYGAPGEATRAIAVK